MNHPLLVAPYPPIPRAGMGGRGCLSYAIAGMFDRQFNGRFCRLPNFKTNITSLLITIEYTSVWDSDNPTK